MKKSQEKLTIKDAITDNDSALAFLEQELRAGGENVEHDHVRPHQHPSGELLHDYVYGWLSEAETLKIQDHLVSCEMCALEVLRITDEEEELDQVAAKWANEAPIKDRLISTIPDWVKDLWKPPLVGQVVTAADIPRQEHVFQTREGSIKLWCTWQSEYRKTPAHISVSWKARLSVRKALWVIFAHPETQVPLAEFLLGTDLEGKKVFTRQDLGFDPSREPWAVAVVLREAKS